MKKYAVLLVIVVVVITGFLLRPKKAQGPESTTQKTTAAEDSTKETNQANNKEDEVDKLQFPGVLPDDQIVGKKVVITTIKGTIEFELLPDMAPKTVSNFVYLANHKYFDGITFHRVEPGFVIQGGDPTGTGTGGPGYKFEDEPVTAEYKEGTVAMANAGPNTNGSQFFICLEDQPTLPKNYTIFGQVTTGMDVVKNIEIGDKMQSVVIADK